MKILFFFLTCLAVCVCAQEPVSGSSSKLNDQYRRLQEEVEVVEGYRMVRMLDVERLWKSVNDSLRLGEAVRQQMGSDITRLRDSVVNLSQQLAAARQREEELQGTLQSISVLGFKFNKSFYRLLSLGIIAGLLLIIAALVVTGRLHIKAANEARSMYDELYHEFDRYRHNAVEQQIKLSRELQDYRNRQAGLKSA